MPAPVSSPRVRGVPGSSPPAGGGPGSSPPARGGPGPSPPAGGAPVVRLGRYELHEEIASGGMATIHLGRLSGPAGFSRTVAIKRLHPQFAKDPEFVTMLLDE